MELTKKELRALCSGINYETTQDRNGRGRVVLSLHGGIFPDLSLTFFRDLPEEFAKAGSIFSEPEGSMTPIGGARPSLVKKVTTLGVIPGRYNPKTDGLHITSEQPNAVLLTLPLGRPVKVIGDMVEGYPSWQVQFEKADFCYWVRTKESPGGRNFMNYLMLKMECFPGMAERFTKQHGAERH